MKFHLIFTISLTMVFYTASAQTTDTDCDGASAEVVINYDDNNTHVEVKVTRLESPINYYFFNEKGEMLNKDIKSNKHEELTRGNFMCYLIDRNGCSKKLDFIVEENPKNNE